jgi:multidrug resistance efflux pump
MFSLFIPMGWGAPHGPALVVRNSVAVVPDVAGEVTDVPVQANQPLKAGDVLFKIGVEVQQIYTRYIEPGQEVELTFKFFPGQVFTGKVVLEATATGQGRTLSARSSCGRSRY